VNYVLEEEQIDTIMHFAAQTHVGKQMQCFMYTLVD
jgi:UDP-glucose 4-epimerase